MATPILSYDALPPNSRIQCAVAGEVLTIAVPPDRLRASTLIGLLFGILVFAGGVLIASGALNLPFTRRLGLISGACLSTAVIAGCLVLEAIAAMRKHCTINAGPAGLHIGLHGLLSVREYQWPPAELRAIELVQFGTNIFGRRICELRILSTSSAPLSLLTGREQADLRWIAHRLCEHLALPAPPPSA